MATTIIPLEKIKALVGKLDIISAMEEGFIAYSNGNAVVPPVGELLLDDPKGEVHIKYGYIKNDAYYVIKIASGFYGNSSLGLPTGQGMMLLFSQNTGEPVAILLDEGHLTDIRTAAAGALVAKYFAPKQLKAIGIIGTGIQARLQLLHFQEHNPCKEVYVWGRNRSHAEKLTEELKDSFSIHVVDSPAEVAANCNLIVTTTPSKEALLQASDIQKGTHITAVGADTEYKQELASKLLAKADIVVSDSISQSKNRGEIYQAVKDGSITHEKVIELGAAIQNPKTCRTHEDQITIADLTGVAVQDMKIAEAVYKSYTNTLKTINNES